MQKTHFALASAATLTLAASAGLAEQSDSLIWTAKGVQRDLGKSIKVGGEVFAALNGDMVLVPAGAVRPSLQTAGATEPLWLCSDTDPCDNPGGPGPSGINPFLGVDSSTDTDGDGDPDGTFTDIKAHDSGDIAFDSLACGMRIFIGSTEPTPDTDGDGTPDSTASSLCVVSFTDNDDNFGSGIPGSGGVLLTGFALPHFGDPTPTDAYVTVFFYTWDFSADFVDATGNPIDASFTIGNTGSATDIDSDGLADFGYDYEFEWADTNSDGDLDVYTSLVFLGAPVGDLVDGGDPTVDFNYTIENVMAPQGTGAREDIDIWNTDPAGVADPTYLGTIAGFSATVDPDGTPNSGDEFPVRGLNCVFSTPFAQLALDLFTADTGCDADFNGDGFFNNTDINLFVTAFLGMDPQADLNGDGFFNNTDINLFVTLFLSQCA